MKRYIILVVVAFWMFSGCSVAPVMGQAIGNVWISPEVTGADSLALYLNDANGTRLLKKTAGNSLDTVISASTLLRGMNNFTVAVDYGGVWSYGTPDIVQNSYTGTTKATGTIPYSYTFSLCDSFMLINEYLGARDTITYTNISSIDVVYNCVDLGLGLNNFKFRYKYSGSSDWLSSWDIFNNSVSDSIPAPSAGDFCNVYFDANGSTPGIRLTATLLKGPYQLMVDTCNSRMITTYSAESRTDIYGRALVTVLKSKCLAPGGGIYQFDIYNPRTGVTATIRDSVPDSSSYRLKIRGM
jgi:hypothetical protein